MSPLEIVAASLGLANIILIVRRSLWNYPIGIAQVTLYFFILFETKLYSDALLQIFFLIVQLYGWWCWLKGRDTAGDLIVLRATPQTVALWVVAIATATAAWGSLMHRYTDATLPWWDASVAMGSIGAQIMMSRRYIENWAAWVIVDAISIPLYAMKSLWLTAGLYAVLLLICLLGWREWSRVARTQRDDMPVPA